MPPPIPSSWRPLGSGLPITPRKIAIPMRAVARQIFRPKHQRLAGAAAHEDGAQLELRHRQRPRQAWAARGRIRPGDTAEDRTGHQARAARIVVMEEAADHLAAGEEARDRPPVGADHLRAIVDLEPAERKRDAAGDRIGENGGVSSFCAQFDFGSVSPRVAIPSRSPGLKLPWPAAALNSSSVRMRVRRDRDRACATRSSRVSAVIGSLVA